jgi:phage shock protein PspC (stress-responsive transcriptional regulator)
MTQATPYKQLRRPLDDRMVAGVCSGVARYANIDPILVRIAFVVLALVTWGWALLAYPVMWLLMPEEPRPEAPAWRDPADPSWGRPAAGTYDEAKPPVGPQPPSA